MVDKFQTPIDVSSLVFRGLTFELKRILSNSYITKIYHDSEGISLRLKRNSETYTLILINQFGLVLQEKEKEHEEPDSIANLLKKYLIGGMISDVWQHQFDRVLIFDVKSDNASYQIVIECFRNGNISVLHNWQIIWTSQKREWKGRKLMQGEKYLFPPSRCDPLSLTETEMKKMAATYAGPVEKFIATEMGLGRDVAIYITNKLRIFNKQCRDLDNLTYENIYNLWNKLLSICTTLKCAVNKITDDVDIFNEHSDNPEWISYNPSEFLYYIYRKGREDQNERIMQEKSEKITKEITYLNAQRSAIEIDIIQQKRKIEEIYVNYTTIDDVLSNFIDKDEKEVADYLLRSGIIKAYNGKTHTIKITLGTDDVELYIHKKIEYTIAHMHEKIKGLSVQLRKIDAELTNKNTKNGTEPLKKEVKIEKKWYEHYHWFFSSNGMLVISGKNSRDNDYIVKKYLKNGEIFIHADLSGAAATIIKSNGKPVPEKTIYEACQFAVCFSRAWTAKHTDADAFWVNKDQVSKTPPSGEFVKKGSWIIYGTKNYVKNITLEIALLMENGSDGKKLLAVPFSAANATDNHILKIYPGNIKKEDFARMLSRKTGIAMDVCLSILPPGDIGMDVDLDLFNFY